MVIKKKKKLLGSVNDRDEEKGQCRINAVFCWRLVHKEPEWLLFGYGEL